MFVTITITFDDKIHYFYVFTVRNDNEFYCYFCVLSVLCKRVTYALGHVAINQKRPYIAPKFFRDVSEIFQKHYFQKHVCNVLNIFL